MKQLGARDHNLLFGTRKQALFYEGASDSRPVATVANTPLPAKSGYRLETGL